MTKDTNQDLQGAKKFLYAGPKRKETGFEEDDPSMQWNFNNTLIANPSSPVYPATANKAGPSEFDLDGVWSIAKNVNLTSKPATLHQPNNRDGWTRNAGKGHYSRHGGITGENESKNKGAEDVGFPSSTTKTYSYSYGKPAQPETSSQASAKSDQLDNRPGIMGNNTNGKLSTYGRYSVQQTGTSPRGRYF